MTLFARKFEVHHEKLGSNLWVWGWNSNFTPTLNPSTSVKETETMVSNDTSPETREELFKRIIEEESLNWKQTIAFHIIANSFFSLMDNWKSRFNRPTDPNDRKSLPLSLKGPGGTGKTHVVKGIQTLSSLST